MDKKRIRNSIENRKKSNSRVMYDSPLKMALYSRFHYLQHKKGMKETEIYEILKKERPKIEERTNKKILKKQTEKERRDALFGDDQALLKSKKEKDELHNETLKQIGTINELIKNETDEEILTILQQKKKALYLSIF